MSPDPMKEEYMRQLIQQEKIVLNQRKIIEQLNNRMEDIHSKSNLALVSTLELTSQIEELGKIQTTYRNKMEFYLYSSVVINFILGTFLCIKSLLH